MDISIEPSGDGYWAYEKRSAGKLPETPLHEVLTWVLRQLEFSMCDKEIDERGDTVTLTLGKAAAPPFVSEDEVLEHVRNRLQAVSLCGVLARSRERGTSPTPRYAALVRQINLERQEGGHKNTEIYYAYELLRTLGKISKRVYKLDAPPTSAPEDVAWYLREATLCWLYGRLGACVALSRACLETSLKIKLGKCERTLGSARLGSDALEILIQGAHRFGYLDRPAEFMATKIRKLGNDVMHKSRSVGEREARECLDSIRSIVEQLFSAIADQDLLK